MVFSYGQSGTIKLEIKKAPARAGAFSAPRRRSVTKSFIYNILAVSPMIAIFWRNQCHLSEITYLPHKPLRQDNVLKGLRGCVLPRNEGDNNAWTVCGRPSFISWDVACGTSRLRYRETGYLFCSLFFFTSLPKHIESRTWDGAL